MFKILKTAKLAIVERKLIYRLYKNEIAIIRVGCIKKEPRIKKDVR